MISDTSNAMSRAGARAVLLVVAAVLGGCSHVEKLWPWHHAPAAPEPPVNELVATAPAPASSPVLPQTWDRNALRVDLTGLAGEGELTLRPVEGHGWPIRLEFAVRPGSFARLEVHGEQRLVLNVPATGGTAIMAVPPGLYAPATGELSLRYGP